MRGSARLFDALPRQLVFTVDLEPHGAAGRAGLVTRRLLALLAARGARATFFVLDAMAREDPGLMRDIARQGHEIASHGFVHRRLAEDGPAAFRAGLLAARDRLAALTGQAPLGYRAPFFSLTPAAAWAPAILAEAGFAYSSSVLPAWNPLAGWPGAPRRPFLWPCGLLELPVPVARCGPFRLPFLGGAYLRWLPSWRLARLCAQWAEAAPGGVPWSYCHPYDLDAGQAVSHRPDLGPLARLALACNRDTMLPRLAGLLEGRQARPFAEALPALRAAAAPWDPRRGEDAPDMAAGRAG